MAKPQAQIASFKSNWLAWLLILGTPLIFTPFGTDPYTNVRLFWMTALAIGAWWKVRKDWKSVLGKQNRAFLSAVLAFAGFGILSLLNSLHPIESGVEIFRWLMLGGLTLILALEFRKKSFQNAVLQAMVVVTLTLTVLWALQKLEMVGSIPAHGDPGAATLGNLNFYAAAMLFLLPACLLLAVQTVGKWRILSILAAVSALLMVVLGKSAGAILALAILAFALGEGIFVLRKPETNYAKKTIFRIAFWFLLATLSLFLFWQFGRGLRQESSGLERQQMAEKTLEMIGEYPIMGIGAGEWPYRILEKGMVSNYQGFATRYLMQAHNDFLQMTAERGILGGIAFFLLLAIPFWRAFRRTANGQKDWEATVAAAAILAWAAFAMTSLPAFRPTLVMLLLVYVGMALAKNETVESKHGPKLAWIFILASILCLVFSALHIRSDVASLQLISAKTEQNWPKVGQLAAKQRTWFNQNDGVAGTPIVWYEGLAYLSMQDYPKAVEKLELAKQYSPWHPQVLSNLGVALYLNNQQEKGIQQLEDLLLLYPDFEDVRMNLCEIYLTRGNKDARVIELISYWKTHTGNPKYDGYYAKIAAFLLERSQHDTPNQQQE